MTRRNCSIGMFNTVYGWYDFAPGIRAPPTPAAATRTSTAVAQGFTTRREVRFAWKRDVSLAYQIAGDGETDIVYLQGGCSKRGQSLCRFCVEAEPKPCSKRQLQLADVNTRSSTELLKFSARLSAAVGWCRLLSRPGCPSNLKVGGSIPPGRTMFPRRVARSRLAVGGRRMLRPRRTHHRPALRQIGWPNGNLAHHRTIITTSPTRFGRSWRAAFPSRSHGTRGTDGRLLTGSGPGGGARSASSAGGSPAAWRFAVTGAQDIAGAWIICCP
jgi:hypothetical protein